MQGNYLYLFKVDELNRFIIDNLEYCNKHLEDFKDDNLFKIEDINFRLKKLHRIFKDNYEYGLELTERLTKLLQRDYKNSVNML